MHNLINSDSLRFRSYFKEMSKLRGIPVWYRYPMEQDFTLHTELRWDVAMSDITPLNIIFDENPRITTLRNLGWVSELPENKPYVMYLPMDTPSLTAGSQVIIPSSGMITFYDDDANTEVRLRQSSDPQVLDFVNRIPHKNVFITKYSRMRANFHFRVDAGPPKGTTPPTMVSVSVKYVDNVGHEIFSGEGAFSLELGDNYIENMELELKLKEKMIIHTQEVDYHTIVEVTSNNDNVYLLYDDRSNLMTDLGAGRLFQVTQIQTNMQFADCYICNVAPVFYQNKARVDNDYSDSDDHYITRIDERLYQ